MAVECPLTAVNGVTRSVFRSARHLADAGHTVVILAPRGASRRKSVTNAAVQAPERRLLPPSVSIVEVASVPVPMYRGLAVGIASNAQIDEVLESFRPDVVHLAAPVIFGARVARVAQRRGIKVVSVFQTDLAGFVEHYGAPKFVARSIWRGLRWVHDQSALTLAPTPSVADEINHHGISPVKVWGRGVDQHQFDPERRSEELRRSWEVDSRVAVGFVGRLAAEKQLDRLQALNHHHDVKLVLIGDGPRRAHLERLLPNAVFTGELHGEDLGQAMASLDIFVHTGENETFCQTIQEAMAAQVAVVAPAAGGPVDLITSAGNGLLYEPGDTDDLVANVEKLVADPDRRSALARAGRSSIANRTWAAVVNELVAHYQWVLASNGGARRRVGGRLPGLRR